MLLLSGWLIVSTAAALDAREPLADPAQQALYERLIQEVRCLVCQNQTIGDSSAPLCLLNLFSKP